jgi:tetratricopeptide (TPR) repeat protein
MAGHLARALAPRFDRALVLGDSQALVTAGLVRDLVERTTVAVPHAEAVRALAEANEAVAAALLHPSVTLVRGANERVVLQADDQDIVVEVARTPWIDGVQGTPGPRQLRARRELLEARRGLYLLVVTVTRMDESAFRGMLADFLSVFPQTWAFLPPSGADQLLLAGWVGEASANWDQFLAVETIARTQLSVIGLGSALDLADRAAVGPGGLAKLAEGGVSPRRLVLPSNLHDGPYLSLELLEPYLEGPGSWLDVGPMTQVSVLLEDRVAGKRSFLRLLSSAARGDQQGVFNESRALLAAGGGERALEPILAPYLQRAAELLAEAHAAGLGSQKWTQALAELEAARLMNPRSTTTLAMLGDTHLSLGNVPKAIEKYERVLELDPGHLQALLGSAQAALIMDRFGQAEDLLRQATERNVRSWMAHHNMGEFQANAHRYKAAERHLKIAVDLSGGQQAAPFAALSTVYFEQGDVAASLFQANRALQLQDTPEHRYLVSRAHFKMENYGIALIHAQKGALRDSGHLGCHFIVGMIQGLNEQHSQCVRSFKRVLELDPGNEPAIANLRRCQAEAESEAASEPG